MTLGGGIYKDLPMKPPSDLLVLFAHHDPHSMVDDYVFYHLRALRALGATIVFVSNCPSLDPDSVDALRSLCAGVYARPSVSHDFGSWNHGWKTVDFAWKFEAFARIALVNDSCYGPLFPLDEMWSTFEDADMYGAVESGEQRTHLQSFFVAWDRSHRTDTHMRHFWSTFHDVDDKDERVRRFELGLSTDTGWNKLTFKPYVSQQDARDTYQLAPNHQWSSWFDGPPLNNSLYVWDLLIQHRRFPFLKTMLPRYNRPWHDSLYELPEFLSDHAPDYPYKLIADNCERLGCGPESWTRVWAPTA